MVRSVIAKLATHRRMQPVPSSVVLRAGAYAHPLRIPHSAFRTRQGITLIEVLISIFVLLFGLMGVAAIFPVASHYVLEGDKRDRSSGLAQIAFEEIKARKLLESEWWIYANYPMQQADGNWVIQSGHDDQNIAPQPGMFRVSDPMPAHAYVIDPLGSGGIDNNNPFSRFFFPGGGMFPQNPWPTLTLPGTTTPKSLWPVLRVTLPVPENPVVAPSPYLPMPPQTAETIFRLRDDLAVEQPDAGDRPSIQRWATGTGGQLLARQYIGDYSWLATVVPTSNNALLGLQPAANIRDAWYEVSAVVFYKRDTVPSASTPGSPGSERLIAGEFLNRSELAIFDGLYDDPATVDTAVDGLKPGNWVAVMGVNQVTGVFMMKWYRVQAIDDTTNDRVQLNNTNFVNGRYMMVRGPDWPRGSYTNLRVAILPGIVDVYTRVMQIE